MCFPKPKKDPAVAELAKLQQAQAAEQKAQIAAGITEQKEEDKEQAITMTEGMKKRQRGRGKGRRRTMLAGGQGYDSRSFGMGRFG
tara:strand:- start:11099 stop:11356 length:258 start_codon:yes stop_codon:yes gene_type:complete